MMTERPFDFAEMVNGPDFNVEDEGVDIMRNPRAFRASQPEMQQERFEQDPPQTLDAGRNELDKDEARRSYAIEQVISLTEKGYRYFEDPIKEAARLDHWLATGETGDASHSGEEAPGSDVEPSPAPQPTPESIKGERPSRG
jgi:hypothetical protein